MATAKNLNPDGFEELVQELMQYDHHNGHQFGPMIQVLSEVAVSLKQLKDVKTEEEFEANIEIHPNASKSGTHDVPRTL